MTFWQFAGEHPIVTLALGWLVVLAIDSITNAISSTNYRGKP